jgi:Ser/Thr protein kinase RdoA (MazF antagonist)
MDKLHPVVALAAFDGVTRGDAAPGWVHDGIVDAWALPDADTVATLIVVSENVTFRVRVRDTAAFVVRIGRPGYADRTQLRSELQWVEALRQDVDLPTPAPVRGADGDLVQDLSAPDGSVWTAVAFDHVDGSVLEDAPDVTAHFGRIGSLTRLMHDHARAWRAPERFSRGSWSIDELVGAGARFGDWRDADLLPGERTLLERAETAARVALTDAGVDRSPAHFGLVHGDLRPSNVMVSTAGAVSVIDFDDCGFGFYLYDFAAALTFYEHRPEGPEMAARWLDGYAAGEPLDDASLRAATALSMLRRLTMLGWATTHRSDALPADLWDENLPGTVHVAERFLADPRWLTRS